MAVLPERIDSIIDGTSAKVVDPPVLGGAPAYPSYTLNGIIGALMGVLISLIAITVGVVMDVTVQEEEDIAELCNHPVLAAVPDMTATSKGGYYGYAGQKQGEHSKQTSTVGKEVSFAAAEAYKLLLKQEHQPTFQQLHQVHYQS